MTETSNYLMLMAEKFPGIDVVEVCKRGDKKKIYEKHCSRAINILFNKTMQKLSAKLKWEALTASLKKGVRCDRVNY